MPITKATSSLDSLRSEAFAQLAQNWCTPGDVTWEDRDGASYSGDTAQCKVYVRFDDDAPDSPTTALTLSATFAPGSAEIVQADLTDRQGNTIGSRHTADSHPAPRG